MAAEDTQKPCSDSELGFAVVAPVGTDLDQFEGCLGALLKQFGYAVNAVRLSALAVQVGRATEPPKEKYVERLNRLMNAGNEARLDHAGEILGLGAAAQINGCRRKNVQA